MVAHPAPADGQARDCLYLGSDWLLYAGTPGDYAWSEMLAPCLVLAAPGAPLRLAAGPQPVAEAMCWQHPAAVWSRAQGAGIVLLYLDPLSPEGMCLQHGQPGVAARALPAVPAWEPALFDALCHGAGSELARHCVSHWRRTVLGPVTPAAVDARLLAAAGLVAGQPEGRLDLAALAQAVQLSPEHLRKAFKQVTGMTLSRYQMLQRLRAMVHHACAAQRAGAAPHGETMVHAAGFYDTPHGNRALRQYFGLSVGSAAPPHGRFVDCTG